MSWSVQTLPLNGPLFEGAIDVYGAAFLEPPYSDADRGAEVRYRLQKVHSTRRGYRGLIALEDETVTGMCYGYRGSGGQWWHDAVVAALNGDARRTWMEDSFELVEIAVHPKAQGHGVGSGLIRELLTNRPESTCVLSTRIDSRAHILYARHGFEVIHEMAFSRGGAPFYIMGKALA
jgi:ribosomal protein S18 acetylase RimI-like enzyme